MAPAYSTPKIWGKDEIDFSNAGLPCKNANVTSNPHTRFKGCENHRFLMGLGLPVCCCRAAWLTLQLWLWVLLPQGSQNWSGRLIPIFLCHLFLHLCQLFSRFPELLLFLSLEQTVILTLLIGQSHVEESSNPPSYTGSLNHLMKQWHLHSKKTQDHKDKKSERRNFMKLKQSHS